MMTTPKAPKVKGLFRRTTPISLIKQFIGKLEQQLPFSTHEKLEKQLLLDTLRQYWELFFQARLDL
jgi:hypothetical protein